MGNLSVKTLELENELEAEVERKRDRLDQECKAKTRKTLQSGVKRVFDPGGAHVQADGVDMDKSDKSDLFPYYDAAWAHNDSVIQVKAASARSEIKTADYNMEPINDDKKKRIELSTQHTNETQQLANDHAVQISTLSKEAHDDSYYIATR